MAVAYRAGTTAGNASGGNLTINKPTGTLDDDILVVVLYREAGTWTLPSGWAQWGSDQQDFDTNMFLTVAWKRASSEGSSYTFNLSTTTWRIAAMAAFSGCTTSGDPIDCTPVGRGTNESMVSGGPIASSITNATANSMNVAVTGNFNGTDVTAGSSGYTAGAALGGCEIWYVIQAASGASGNKSFGGMSGSDTGLWATIHISLKEASGSTNYPRSISFTQSSSLSAARVAANARTASLTQSSTLTAARAFTGTRTVSLSTASTLSAARVVGFVRGLALSTASTLSVARALALGRTLALSVASALSATRLGAFARTVSLSTGNTFSAQRAQALGRVVSLSVASALSAARQTALARVISLSTASAMTFDRAVGGQARSISLSVASAFSAARTVAATRVASFGAANTFTAARAQVLARNISFSAGSALSAAYQSAVQIALTVGKIFGVGRLGQANAPAPTSKAKAPGQSGNIIRSP